GDRRCSERNQSHADAVWIQLSRPGTGLRRLVLSLESVARDQQLVFELRNLSRIRQAVPSWRNQLRLEPVEVLKGISSRPVRGGCFLAATPNGHVRPKPVRSMNGTFDHPARHPVLSSLAGVALWRFGKPEVS